MALLQATPANPAALFVWNGTNLTVANCTLTANVAADGPALGCDSTNNQPSTVVFTNCILWDGGDEFWNNDASTITVTYSNVQGGYAGEGNIDADPLFVEDPSDGGDGWGVGDNDDCGDLHLEAGSPCIDTGSPNGNYSGQTDMDGEPRVANGAPDVARMRRAVAVPAKTCCGTP